ncbi:MAG: nucleotide sugar dehydrogenase, partial [Desulfurococcales archaeon]|nr:nucleotide sugar dehydrogenase [Desulfurococcales archaeon]
MVETSFSVDAIKSGKAWISVYGVGYVGLSLIAVLLRKGFRVIGVDINEERLKLIEEGKLWFNELEIKEAVSRGLEDGRLKLTSDGEGASREALIKIITVPVKVDWLGKTFNLRPIEDVGRTIAKGLKVGDLVILESSVPPGTTAFTLRPVLESHSGLRVEKDFFLAYSPERVYIGHAVKDIEVNYPKIVGGVGKKSLEAAAKFYSQIASKGVIKLSSTTAAEFEKLAEGVYRDVNIALANELALASMKLGVDFFEVRKAANSQPYSHIHLPGPGVGGYCIPLYPYFLAETLLRNGYVMELTLLSRRINEGMPY